MASRLRAAFNALMGKSPGLADYAAATVRPWEEGSQQRWRQTDARSLCGRFSKYVAVAGGRNATAVAGNPLKVYRRKKPGVKSAFDSRPVERKELLRQRVRGSEFVKKAADLSDEVDEITDASHPLVKLIARPNPLMGTFGLLEQTQLALGLAGSDYWHIVFGGSMDVPVELWPLPPQFVYPIPSRELLVGSYVYGRGTEVETTIPAEEIIAFMMPNPKGDPFRGFGDLEKCVLDADLSVAFSEFRLATVYNGAQPGLVVVAKDATEKQRQEIEEKVNRKFQGQAKAGRSIVLNGEVEVKPWNMTEKEVAFLDSDASVRETIANCHDMSSALLTLDSAALATAEAAIPQWQEQAIKPRCHRIEDTINRVLVPFFDDPRLYVCFGEVVQKNWERQSIIAVSMYTADIITKNEARASMDYDMVDDGDRYASDYKADQATNLAELTASLAPEPTPAAAPAEPAKPEPDAPPPAKGVSHAAVLFGGEYQDQCTCHTPPKGRRIKSLENLRMTEAELESTLRSWFRGPALTILSSHLGSNGLRGEPDKALAESLAPVVEPLAASVYLRGWNQGVVDLGKAPGKAEMQSALTKDAAAYLREYVGKLVKSVSATTDSIIRNELADGIEKGETIPQLTQRLRGALDDMSAMAAERIARTEVARAFMSSRESAWMASSVVWGKRWQTAPDACEFCVAAAADYGTQPLGTPFFSRGDTITAASGRTMLLDYSDIDGPPLHPNDRCTMVAVLQEPKE